MYCQSVRAEVLKANPTLKQTEIMAKTGEMWKGLSDAEKAKWTKKAADAKDAYIAEHGKVNLTRKLCALPSVKSTSLQVPITPCTRTTFKARQEVQV